MAYYGFNNIVHSIIYCCYLSVYSIFLKKVLTCIMICINLSIHLFWLVIIFKFKKIYLHCIIIKTWNKSLKKEHLCWTKYVFVKQNKFSSVRKIAYMRLQIWALLLHPYTSRCVHYHRCTSQTHASRRCSSGPPPSHRYDKLPHTACNLPKQHKKGNLRYYWNVIKTCMGTSVQEDKKYQFVFNENINN